jgi:hypothetical protein
MALAACIAFVKAGPSTVPTFTPLSALIQAEYHALLAMFILLSLFLIR